MNEQELLAQLPDGYYAINDPNHPDHTSTWRKRTHHDTAELVPDRDTRNRNYGHTRGWRGAARDAILAAPQEARERYAKIHIRCYWCGRKLTDPESQAAGIGPICRSDR